MAGDTKRAEARKPEAILGEIEAKLATVDGISTSDAFALGRMVMEYGQACAGKASADFLVPLLEGLTAPRPPRPLRDPWEQP